MSRIEEIEAKMQNRYINEVDTEKWIDFIYLLNRVKELETEWTKAKDLTLDQYCRSLPCDYRPLQEYDALLKEREWQPIESAPINSVEPFLVATENARGEFTGMAVVRIISVQDPGLVVCGTYEENEIVYYSPTHWQPLPPPPKEKE